MSSGTGAACVKLWHYFRCVYISTRQVWFSDVSHLPHARQDRDLSDHGRFAALTRLAAVYAAHSTPVKPEGHKDQAQEQSHHDQVASTGMQSAFGTWLVARMLAAHRGQPLGETPDAGLAKVVAQCYPAHIRPDVGD